jgi:hypothetical protein
MSRLQHPPFIRALHIKSKRVPQPVRRDRLIDADRLRCSFHHVVNGALAKPATFAAYKHGIIGVGVAAQ